MSPGPFGHAQDESETPEEHYVDKEKHVVEQLWREHQTGWDVGRTVALCQLLTPIFHVN